ncbi:PAS domain S-box-containing protein [Desulfomicrobium norvegicum]|uniref:histidine kinase n=1 Tax=Desulfomicrobium norvegicum (strain DSM 1741 / NCIMB 8310) TaxID=52561 RepID=A0A8G2BZT8_DESNO|nr:ATP-binding protein [Desulfomicrobium norvegicum]SFL28103.1 PAS domain S-box-containing protein [Desulfomicrobium norvegicum]
MFDVKKKYNESVGMTKRYAKQDHLFELNSRETVGRDECFSRRIHEADSSNDARVLNELKAQQSALMMQNEELRRALDNLENKLAVYSDFYNYSPQGFISLDEQGRVREVNPWAISQLGVERDALVNSFFGQRVASQDMEKFRVYLDLVFKTGERQSCELMLKRKNMQDFRVKIDSVKSSNSGHIVFYMSPFTDIADIAIQKISSDVSYCEADEKFHLSSDFTEDFENKFQILLQQFHAVLSGISGTVIVVSPEMKVLWSNIINEFGINSNISDNVLRYCNDFVGNCSVLYEKSVIIDCFNTGEKKSCIVTHGESVLDIRAFPVKENKDVISVLLLVCDVTGKMAIQADAQYACHLLSLGELAASVAHEINNPVNGIINYGQILVNECDAESMEHDLGARILKEGERIGRLVKSLLSYAHERRKEKRATQVVDILEETLALTQAQIRKDGIQLVLDFPESLPKVMANLQQVQQGFINIISNARYALNEKYPGWHKNKCLAISGEFVMVEGCPFVRVAFLDQGGGISAEKLSFLTKPFFSTKPFGKGTGLGLSITQKIIDDHGGHLRFESEEGEFTRVIIDLPVHQKDEGIC